MCIMVDSIVYAILLAAQNIDKLRLEFLLEFSVRIWWFAFWHTTSQMDVGCRLLKLFITSKRMLHVPSTSIEFLLSSATFIADEIQLGIQWT